MLPAIPGFNQPLELSGVHNLRVCASALERASRAIAIAAKTLADHRPNVQAAAMSFLLLHRIVRALDAASGRVLKGRVDAAKSQLRIVLEAKWYIDFLAQDIERQPLRALSLEFAEIEREIRSLQRARALAAKDGEDWKYLAKDEYADVFGGGSGNVADNCAQIDRAIESRRDRLRDARFGAVAEEFERLRAGVGAQGNARPRTVEWYQCFGGPNRGNLRELAAYLRQTYFYEFLYRGWSESIHPGGLFGSVAVDRGGNVLHHVCHIDGVESATSSAISLCMAVSKSIVQGFKVPDPEWKMAYAFVSTMRLRESIDKLTPVRMEYLAGSRRA